MIYLFSFRLIVSGPVDDHSPQPISNDRHSSFEYVPEQYDYSAGYDVRSKSRERDWQEPIYYDEKQERPDARQYSYEDDNHDAPNHGSSRQNSHNIEQYPYEKDNRRNAEPEQTRNIPTNYQNEENGSNIHEEIPSRFKNRPYPKLAEPYSVLNDPTLNKKNPTVKGTTTEPALDADEYEQQQEPGPSAERNLYPEYYDNLYEEFMEAAYDGDYYDQLAATEPKKDENVEPPKLEEQYFDRPSTPLRDNAPLRKHGPNLRISNTRRLPPSDMYTTSRSTVEPKVSTSTSSEAIIEPQSASEESSLQITQELPTAAVHDKGKRLLQFTENFTI